jgi:hypothetical protein
MPRKQAISSCNCCHYSPLPSWKTPRVDENNERLVRFDADARGLLLPASAIAQNTFADGPDPSPSDLAQSISASILDGQVAAEFNADAVLFEHGRQEINAGFYVTLTPKVVEWGPVEQFTAILPVHTGQPPEDPYNYNFGWGFAPVTWSDPEPFVIRLGPSDLDGWYVVPGFRPVTYFDFGSGEWKPVAPRSGFDQWPLVPSPVDDSQEPVESQAFRRNIVVKPGVATFRNMTYYPNTGSDLFANTFWALHGNVLHSRYQDYRDYWVCRFRLRLGGQERLWMPLGDRHTQTGVIGSVVVNRASNACVDSVCVENQAIIATNTVGAPSANVSIPVVKLAAVASGHPSKVIATAYTRATDDTISGPNGWGGSTPLGLIYKTGRSNSAQAGFSKDPLAGVSFGSSGSYVGSLAVYRNGTLEATLTNSAKAGNWQSAAIEQATTEEGSYLLVGDNTADDSNGPMFVLSSLVVDKTPPIGVVKQLGDFYVGDPTGLLPSGQEFDGWVSYATSCVEESEPCSGGIGARNWTRAPGGIPPSNLKDLPLGEYVFRQSGPVYDRAGNNLNHLPELRFNVRPLPGIGQQYGPVPSIVLPENKRGTFVASGSCCRSALYDEPVQSIVIRFDKPVTGLKVSHIKIERRSVADNWAAVDLPLSGERPPRIDVPDVPEWQWELLTGNVTLVANPESASEYVLMFREGPRVHNPVEQPSNSVFYLTVDPELDAEKVIGPPDESDEPIETEKCRLSARAMWGIMPEAGKNLDRINTQAVDRGIGGVSSVTKEITISDTDENGNLRERPRQIAVSTSSSVTLNPSTLRLTEVDACKGFVPRVPPHPHIATAGDTASYGFFGVGSTIYPAAPASVPACATPSERQFHSSALCTPREIVGWTVTFRTESGGMLQSSIDAAKNYADWLDENKTLYPQARTLDVDAYTAYLNSLGSLAADSEAGKTLPDPRLGYYRPLDPPYWDFLSPNGADGAFTSLDGQTPRPQIMSFSDSLQGYKCQQNIWSLVGDSSRQAWLSVSRLATEYPSMKTAFLWRPAISIVGYFARQVGPFGTSRQLDCPANPVCGDFVISGTNAPLSGVYEQWSMTDYRWERFMLNDITLSPSQEATISAGQPLEVLYANDISGVGVWGSIVSGAAGYLAQWNLIPQPQPPAGGGARPAAFNQTDTALANYMVDNIKFSERYYVTLAPTFAS